MKASRLYGLVLAMAIMVGGCKEKAPEKGMALRTAARTGDIEQVRELIALRVDVNARDRSGRTALHIAAGRGQTDIVQLLIQSCAHVDPRDTEGCTPLHLAAAGGQKDTVKVLLDNRADLEARDREGRSPLQYAATRGHAEVVELLLNKGADINVKDKAGGSLLYKALLKGDGAVALVLIAKGADVRAKDGQGSTLLHTAAAHAPCGVVEAVIARGADVNARSGFGSTPLHEAARRGRSDVVKLLLAKGADLNARTRQGQTALDCAHVLGFTDVERLLGGEVSDSNAQPGPGPGTGPLTDEQIVVLNNSNFALDLYQRLRTSEGNLFFSPYSISTALAMTYAGARGDTARQMAQTLRFSLDEGALHPAFAEVHARLMKLHEAGQIKFCLANSLWPQKDYRFLEDYLSLARTYYGVSITPMDYIRATETARATINRWVADKTEQKIQDIIQPGILDSLTRLVLVNAVYFKANWEYQFKERLTREAPFYVEPNRPVQVPMMNQEINFRYAESDTAQAVELPYLGHALSMVILLPKKVDGLASFEAGLSMAELDQWIQGINGKGPRQRRTYHDLVIVLLPRFKMTSQFRLDQTLQDMGMKDAFIPGKADFSGMDGRYDLFIQATVHKAFVEVNEKGTEAGAATYENTSADGGHPPVFRADHPFLFLIQETRTGSILFMGRVVDPTQGDRQ